MPSMLNEVLEWLDRAEQAREVAGQLTDPSARKAVLELAESFDRLARAARYPGCAPETRVGDERPAKKLIVSPARSSSRTQVRLVGRTGPWREAGPISTAARRGGVSSRSYSRGSGVDCPTPRRRHLDPYFRLYRDL